MDPRRAWLVAGTDRGSLVLWDLRLKIPLRYNLPLRNTPIVSMANYYKQGDKGRTIIVNSGQNDIYLFNVELGEIVQFISLDQTYFGSGFIVPAEERLRKMYIGLVGQTAVEKYLADNSVLKMQDAENINLNNVRVIITANECEYFITGGVDKILRFWSTVHLSQSYVISGPGLINENIVLKLVVSLLDVVC